MVRGPDKSMSHIHFLTVLGLIGTFHHSFMSLTILVWAHQTLKILVVGLVAQPRPPPVPKNWSHTFIFEDPTNLIALQSSNFLSSTIDVWSRRRVPWGTMTFGTKLSSPGTGVWTVSDKCRFVGKRKKMKGRAPKVSCSSRKVGRKLWRLFLRSVKNARFHITKLRPMSMHHQGSIRT